MSALNLYLFVPFFTVTGLGAVRLRHLSIGYTIGRVLILHVINVVFLLVLVCPLSHDVVLNFELLRTVGKVASTFECELGCQCLYENGVNLQVSEVCVYATYLVYMTV